MDHECKHYAGEILEILRKELERAASHNWAEIAAAVRAVQGAVATTIKRLEDENNRN